MTCSDFKYSNHAVQQMFKRNISADEVEAVIITGEIIKSYPEDEPYPSYLVLGFPDLQPLHVVVSQNDVDKTCYIITAYRPTTELWSNDFKQKNKQQ